MVRSDITIPSVIMDVGHAIHKSKPCGRPPLNYIWDEEHGYVHVQTGVLFDPSEQRTVIRARKTAIERRRYWDPTKDVRARRLLRCRMKNARTTLDEWCVQAATQ